MNWFRKFMVGRYGADEFSFAFVILFILLNIVSLLWRSIILTVIYILLFAYFVFRMLSKNIAARQKENYYFLKAWTPVRHFFQRIGIKISNFRKYKYFTCEKCGKKMRVPRGKGTIMVTCPQCGDRAKRKT